MCSAPRAAEESSWRSTLRDSRWLEKRASTPPSRLDSVLAGKHFYTKEDAPDTVLKATRSRSLPHGLESQYGEVG